MQLSQLITAFEKIAPPQYQESYDNAGLITGHSSMEITGAVICLDSTEEVLDEAIANNCNLIVAHHPIVFTGLKKINGKNYVERAIIKAIKNDIAIYAIHTNLDNVAEGVNKKIAQKIGLTNLKILSPLKNKLCKLVTYAPVTHAEAVRNALFTAGAGSIGNYDECSFTTKGQGTFRANASAKPFSGEKGQRHTEAEERIEVIFEQHLESALLKTLKAAHPYEEVAFDIYALANKNPQKGAGMIGELPEPMHAMDFLKQLKSSMLTNCLRYTKPHQPEVKKIAVCGGSGSFLLNDALSANADALVTADFKYHQFFDADNRIIVADIGHYESEQFTSEILAQILKDNFPTFAVRLSKVNTNPVNYL